ncbi:MAG: hypothetical protein V5A38_10855 [Halolamina sp.]|uniref:hypothetical protein n=1 Tax=Halolamina sp. TaxID=1940283 RepID=UPI002FC2D588
MSQGNDPRRIDTLAVHTDDVLTALEARERGRRPTVLRVLPPFSGRMRARIHVVDGSGQDDGAVHFRPGCFVTDRPPYPTVDDTEDELREGGAYSVERHHEAHARAVKGWRETVRTRLRERIELPLSETGGPAHEQQLSVRVRYLG